MELAQHTKTRHLTMRPVYKPDTSASNKENVEMPPNPPRKRWDRSNSTITTRQEVVNNAKMVTALQDRLIETLDSSNYSKHIQSPPTDSDSDSSNYTQSPPTNLDLPTKQLREKYHDILLYKEQLLTQQERTLVAFKDFIRTQGDRIELEKQCIQSQRLQKWKMLLLVAIGIFVYPISYIAYMSVSPII